MTLWLILHICHLACLQVFLQGSFLEMVNHLYICQTSWRLHRFIHVPYSPYKIADLLPHSIPSIRRHLIFKLFPASLGEVVCQCFFQFALMNKVQYLVICLKATSILIFGKISVYFAQFSNEMLVFFLLILRSLKREIIPLSDVTCKYFSLTLFPFVFCAQDFF